MVTTHRSDTFLPGPRACAHCAPDPVPRIALRCQSIIGRASGSMRSSPTSGRRVLYVPSRPASDDPPRTRRHDRDATSRQARKPHNPIPDKPHTPSNQRRVPSNQRGAPSNRRRDLVPRFDRISNVGCGEPDVGANGQPARERQARQAPEGVARPRPCALGTNAHVISGSTHPSGNHGPHNPTNWPVAFPLTPTGRIRSAPNDPGMTGR